MNLEQILPKVKNVYAVCLMMKSKTIGTYSAP